MNKTITLERFGTELGKKLKTIPYQYVSIPNLIVKMERNNRFKKSYGVRISSVFKTLEYEIRIIEDSFDRVEIFKIYVNEPSKGTGSKLMNNLLKVSDETGIKMRLIPVDYYNPKKNPFLLRRLQNWYKSFGFVRLDTTKPYLTYKPNRNNSKIG